MALSFVKPPSADRHEAASQEFSSRIATDQTGVSYDLYNAQMVRALNYGGVRDWIVA